jgi:hypothetical protein
MDDWEQFFAEKSRRRSEVERLEERRRRTGRLIYSSIIAALVLAAIIGLAILR